ncbi:MAG: hypothetical protein UR69_C0003G0134 [Candidatus Moranbacteria bacterium GW2011_GWE2_35_2-]|nr:MAG: hypothetical protein UR69_C0003G0134 [Candidatus Moranbacteria bacterium GW2011_GWE2_35_2-]KKQ21974.1 MAG: hypothetical protein US37_C0005G0016 [Candidatus Moranbacteria bacterium GW2011_GWF2_37_11]KKQ29095.1 MAG: hypothetical protein US44_C0003G0007 [Candidatus Moranbacteria bacterium GW2011_GWD1_37_17]KKQ31080.1 MAG: hypothetical protein US47_C0001G0313 [Candidatus Moranbacteria bacterium GW2011_GWE1_37_24]KKQ46745.1 MAG: hypothetical protein US66_C0029G0003 [Candidatus Moranbacteria 
MTNSVNMAQNKQKIGTFLLAGFLLAALSFLFLVVSQKSFKASTDYLVVPTGGEDSKDFYSVFKSAEYVNRVLGEVVYSELFIDQVVKTGEVNGEFLPFDRKERLEEWSNRVKVGGKFQYGIVSFEVFANSQKEAVQISNAIAKVMEAGGSVLDGKADLHVQILTGPIWEKNPSVKEIVAVVIGGFLVGVILSAMWAYYFATMGLPREEKEYLESLNEL